MRWKVLLLATGFLVGVAAVALAGDPTEPIDPKIEGWGPLKFGMTMRAVRELDVGPITWGQVQNYDYRVASLPARQSVRAFGSTYGLTLEFAWGQRLFARDKRLSGLEFRDRSPSQRGHQYCERRFQIAVQEVERYYGPLTTTERHRKDSNADSSATLEVTLVPVGRSLYARTEYKVRVPDYVPPGSEFRYATERDAGGRISIDGRWDWTPEYNGDGRLRGWARSCEVTVSVEGKPPANMLD